MDESWRMCIGISTTHHRKSMETPVFPMSHHVNPGDDQTQDFSDVFGGPPKSVLYRKLSGDFTKSESFYEEIFRNSDLVSSGVRKGRRKLPAFRIPAKGEGFYDDISGSFEEFRRSRERSRSSSKAKSKSSSVLSSEELSPLRAVFGDDVGLSSFASTLRPINVPGRWNSTNIMAEQEVLKHQRKPTFPSSCSFHYENLYMESENSSDNPRSSYNHGFYRRGSSPEIISLEPHSFRSVKISVDLENTTPSSPTSSLRQEPESRVSVQSDSMNAEDEEEDEDEDEIMSSYVIEINSDIRESTGEAISIDDAIAWAKERYNSAHSSETEAKSNSAHGSSQRHTDGHETTQAPLTEEENISKAEEKEKSEEQVKMGVLDKDVKFWSSGKENNIRLLLSTLHHILWPNSGWYMIPLTSLTESSQVKKAYQKARLCLHPDKLQQRGATPSQKYVAEKAFTILQDAWAAFVSQDVFIN